MSDIAALLTWTNIRFLLEGLGLTLIISALAIACSIVLGAVISIMRGSSSRLLRGFAIAYVELFKNTPLLLWIMFTFFVAQLPPLPAAVLAFTLFTAASVAEIVRGGLASVPAGQYEAARSQGFSAPQMYLYIILPQALRNMVPALLSQFVTTIKDTSYLWGAMALQELYGKEVKYCCNRKEVKDHGADAGNLLGAELHDGDKVIMVEDVTTSGKSIDETYPILKAAADVDVRGLIVSLNRMEVGKGGVTTAQKEIEAKYGFPVASIVSMAEVKECLHNHEVAGRIVIDDDIAAAIDAYYEQWGAKE